MKKLYVAATLACLSTTAFANTIVPEISRDGKTKNNSVIAVTNQMRTFVAGEYDSGTRENDATSNEIDYSNLNFYGGWANKMLTLEADVNMGEYDDNDVNMYDFQFGYRINEQFALGLGYGVVDTDPDNEDTDLEIAASYNMKGLIIGASFAIVSEDNGTIDGSHNEITLGVGSNSDNMSWEAGLVFMLEEDGDDITSPSRTQLFAGATKIMNNMELDGDISYTMGDASVAGGDFSGIDINFDVEIMVGKMFYITPGLIYETTDNDTTETTEFALSADFGYRANKIDATFGIDYYITDESETAGVTTEYDNMEWAINVAYLF